MSDAASAAAAPEATRLHVMLDIETLGTDESAPVLSIGAVLFDPHETDSIASTFHIDLDVASNTPGEIINVDTVFWWLRQSDSARGAVADAKRNPIAESIEKFIAFASQGLDDPSSICIWANSPSFDIVILRACMKRHAPNLKWPFSPFKERDVRTLLSMTHGHVDRSSGTAHNALDDAIMQALAVQRAKECIHPLK